MQSVLLQLLRNYNFIPKIILNVLGVIYFYGLKCEKQKRIHRARIKIYYDKYEKPEYSKKS